NSDVCATIHIPFDKNAEWEQWVLLSADRHFDNAHSDHAMQRRHLEMAKKRGAVVIDAGDLFDAMQGKGDKRSSKSALRKENVRDDYLNSLQDSVSDFLTPYAQNIALLFEGNHEPPATRFARHCTATPFGVEASHSGIPSIGR